MDNEINFNPDCSDVINISIILNSLKKINECSSIIYYHGKNINYKFNLYDKLNLKEIESLEYNIKHKLPNDYKEFILNSNGLELSNYAKLFSINEIYSKKDLYDFYPENILIIGECCNAEVQIVINLNEKFENCIYVIDVIADDYFYSLSSNFTMFLNRFILAYGSDFWNWYKIKSNILKMSEK